MSDRLEGQDALDPRTTGATLLTLRDMAVDCLMSTHGQYFAESRAALGLAVDEASVRGSAQTIVRLAFETVGGSYDAPTLKTLAQVVNLLSERCLGWGAPPDQIFTCHSDMMREIGRLEIEHSARIDAALRRN